MSGHIHIDSKSTMNDSYTSTTNNNNEKDDLSSTSGSGLSRSSSFIALIGAAEKSPCAEKDAGNKSVDHYKTRLPLWRFKLRNSLLPLIRWETPHLARIQTALRHPLLDIYFALSANLGTHTFYVIMLPVSYWYGCTLLARDLTFILSMGVYLTGFVKDLLCLPRPLSPPLHRITMSGSAALEYGFPSTHTANSVGVGILLAGRLYQGQAHYEFAHYVLYQLLNALFVFSIVVGRIYCGMHGFSDVIVGALMGGSLSLITFIYGEALSNFRIMESYWTLIIIPVTLILVRIHPEPADDCPCFDDGVAFVGVLAGETVGQWLLARLIPGSFGCIHYDFNETGIIGSILRFVVGVSLVVTWRHYMKRILHDLLPPIFRFVEKIGLSMPRKFFIPASQYGDIPQSIPDITLFETHEITSLFSKAGRARSDSVGPQSPADVYESLAYREIQRQRAAEKSAEKAAKQQADADRAMDELTPLNKNNVNYRGTSLPSSTGDLVEEKGITSATSLPISNSRDDHDHDQEADLEEPDLLSTVVIPRVRYDVEVVTKLVVYSGIALVTTFICGYVFRLLGI